MYYSLLFLALNPLAQRDLQSSLDALLSQRPLEEWSYDCDLPALLTGMAGAVMNESLRLMPPFMYVPKITRLGNGPSELTVDGKRMVVPEGCQVTIVLPAAHRNPNCWPVEEGVEDDLDRFRPERWFVTKGGVASENDDTTAPGLYRPPRGAFAPFSDGPRSCVGRRFAQIEIVAVLAVIFLTHSVELSVSDFVTDAEVEQMPSSGAERRKVWDKAAARAMQRMSTGIEESGLGLISRDDRRKIGFRIVKRGEERFLDGFVRA
jgi:cytochrome P450